MDYLRELYQEVIIDHGKNPRNTGILEHPTAIQKGYNPLCGDKVTLFVALEHERIKDLKFVGQGCAISMASLSLMTETLIGKTILEAEKIFQEFHESITDKTHVPDETLLAKTFILLGVKEYPARVKCATLGWHTLIAALKHDESEHSEISTE